MQPQKYKDDIERCKRIGEYIEDRIYRVFGDRGHKKASKVFSELTGVTTSYAGVCITNYRAGHFVVQLSSESRVRSGERGQSEKQKHLKRLAMLFTMLGVEQSDPVVGLAKEVNPGFNYPFVLQNLEAPRKALSLDDVELTVNIKNGRELTQEQIDSLRRLAALYAVD